ncbi:hypothetical protein PACTADRAFT_3884 [Pachysolen tannophilus NRRL Y-2460]|uniref:RNA polymerase II subunit B1 CTD phosphatase RPAP2 homolog n=1 Tax=Pachysolen tannophilus NRRL Y-2460 TaxID=669874 RepID=A0A1E4TTB9_PACTA|nr:hypothetical protein PACTADRAFT_3884 [Pachysolen tannophilus NRRL Y-2460]
MAQTDYENGTVTLNKLEKILEPYRLLITGNSSNKSSKLLTPKHASQLNLTIIELLMDRPCDKDSLKYLSRFLTPEIYNEIVNERIINHFCGWPLCDKYDPVKIKPNLNKIKNNLKFLSGYFKSSYCCKSHCQFSEFYLKQLSDEALFLRLNLFEYPFNHPRSFERNLIILEDFLNELKKAENKDKMLVDIIEEMNNLNIDDKRYPVRDESREAELVELLQNIQIIEKTDQEIRVINEENNTKLDDEYVNLNNATHNDNVEITDEIRAKNIEGYITK